MIHQCYFEASQRARFFTSPLYRGFGLYPSVNPDLHHNCPELEDPSRQPLLSEYAALLHLWRNPDLDPDDWIGFTSYRQLDKFPTLLSDRAALEAALAGADVAGWGFYTFTDAVTGRPISLAEQGERCHPGITSALWRLLLLRNEPMPDNYVTGNHGLFCNFWVMAREHFDDYMRWSWPLVNWCLDQPDDYTRSHPRSLSYLAERLFICWYGLRHKRLLNLGHAQRIVCPPPPCPFGAPSAPRTAPASRTALESFRVLPAWNMSLRELCQCHHIRPTGIIHIGAHHAEERDAYHRLGASRVLWIEADPEHLPQLQANLAGYPGQRAVRACLAEEDGRVVTFHRTNNRGQSSSILPMGEHRIVYPHIQVVGQTELPTTTFQALAVRERLELDGYDFLVLDVQGAELLVLQGFGDLLWGFQGVWVEVNLRPLYQDCALLPQIDAHLARFRLRRRETLLTPRHDGDALYLRPGTHPDPPANLAARAGQARDRLASESTHVWQEAGQGPRVLELREDGAIGTGAGPRERGWQVRACGHEVVLEMLGEMGRSACLSEGDDGVWRGVSLVVPSTAVILARPAAGGLPPARA